MILFPLLALICWIGAPEAAKLGAFTSKTFSHRTLIQSGNGVSRSRLACPEEIPCQTKPTPRHRIVGGCQVQANTMPWQVAIVTSDNLSFNVCGGTILCPKYIMSAAHCSYHITKSRKWRVDELRALVGAHHLVKSRGDIHKIKAFHDHLAYVHRNQDYDYDYSVYEMEKTISLRPDFAMAVYLPTMADQKLPQRAKFAVSGWGNLEGNQSPLCFPMILNAVEVYHVSDEICKSAYKDWTERMLCAGHMEGQKDACQADSGGPLAWLDPKTDEVKLIGAVSYGRECASATHPGVYAEISVVLPWLKNIIGGCNEKTCNVGNCMKGSKLHPSVKNNFFV